MRMENFVKADGLSYVLSLWNVHFHFPLAVYFIEGRTLEPCTSKIVHLERVEPSTLTSTFSTLSGRSSIFAKVLFRENFVLLPDQIQFLNPIMVLILIPTFNYLLYPLFAKVGFLNRALLIGPFSDVLIGLNPFKVQTS